ncbi:hypothetical protein LEP1GSC191_4131 [Leptospira borgpetersenii serovar Mini str. 201000851]|uniref:Uncharacterized protein n=1 Tax=Leptospira borgpetersenii str. 200801926 TaxID=1193009 RepID=A0ABN0HST6_LEPBO|nr:hypothetical protein LEP1GSC128_1077 [Leptospira borgpetersenii str. 200801926]EMN13453.1 hypothetical protein LEP1GSC055_0160 [Leptospira borgpetersenii str. Brem 307]ENO62862.1 hypothetical protein LEP1GSC191_4131 [Leptospira borgpetersenii serovar Mini str. 201000851]
MYFNLHLVEQIKNLSNNGFGRIDYYGPIVKSYIDCGSIR